MRVTVVGSYSAPAPSLEKFLVRRVRALATPAPISNPRDGLVGSASHELRTPGARRLRRELLLTIGGQLALVCALAAVLQSGDGGDTRVRQLLARDVSRHYASSVPVAMVLLFLCIKSCERLAWTAPIALLAKVHYASVSRTLASADTDVSASTDIYGVQASLLLAWTLLLYPIHRLRRSTAMRGAWTLSLVLFTVVQSVLLASFSVDGASSLLLLHCGVLASSLLVAAALSGADWSQHVAAFEAPSTLALGCAAHGAVALSLMALSTLSRALRVSAESAHDEDGYRAEDAGLVITVALVAQLPTALLVSCEVAALQRFIGTSKADAPADAIAFLYTDALDSYYLNDAVYLLEGFLEQTQQPSYNGSIEYGVRDGKGYEHCWTGSFDQSLSKAWNTLNQRMLPKMVDHIVASAPDGADLSFTTY